MSKKNWSNILSVLARTALAFVFVFEQSAWALQGQNATDKSDSKPAAKSQQTRTKDSTAAEEKTAPVEDETVTAEKPPAEENSQPDGRQEGIKVHGHWTIEVRNSDGSVVTHESLRTHSSPAVRTFSPPFWAHRRYPVTGGLGLMVLRVRLRRACPRLFLLGLEIQTPPPALLSRMFRSWFKEQVGIRTYSSLSQSILPERGNWF